MSCTNNVKISISDELLIYTFKLEFLFASQVTAGLINNVKF